MDVMWCSGRWEMVFDGTCNTKFTHVSLYHCIRCCHAHLGAHGWKIKHHTRSHCQTCHSVALLQTVSSTTASVSHSPGEAPNGTRLEAIGADTCSNAFPAGAAPPNAFPAAGVAPPKGLAPPKPPVLPKPGDGVFPRLNAMIDCALSTDSRLKTAKKYF